MKNLLGQKEFRNIKLITEAEGGGMDFSNRTGWSQSLIGRAVNKLFSFGKKTVQTTILQKLKNKLDDEYGKALITTLSQFNITEENAKSEKISDEEIDKIYNSETGEVEDDEDVQTQGQGQGQVQEEKSEEKIKVKQFIVGDTYETTLSNQLGFVNSMLGKIDASKATENDKALLQHVSKGISNELSVVGDESKKAILNKLLSEVTELMKNIKGEKTISDQEYKDELNKKNKLNELTRNYYSIVSKLKSKYPAKKDEISHISKKFIKDIHPDTAKSVDQAKQSYNSFIKWANELKKQKQESFGDLLDVAEKLYEEATTALAKVQPKNDKIAKIDSLKLNKLYDDLGDDNKLGEINVTEFDPLKAYNSMTDETKKKFKQKLVSNVNKESIKEIQLRAEWMYDEEKYKDKRSDVYSRMNWTTTGPDMAKLKNTWLKMISNTKAKYLPFYGDENGNFPKDLDPIALVESDKAFRQKFDQYSTEQLKEKDKFDLTGKNLNLTDDESDKLGLTKGALGDNSVGILECRTSSTDNAKPFGLIVAKYAMKEYIIYEILGLYDTSKIASLANKLDIKAKDEIRKAIESNIYSPYRKNSMDILKAENKNLAKIYDAFVYYYGGTYISEDENITRYKEKSKATGFISKQDIGGSEKKQYNLPFVINIFDESTNNIMVNDKNQPLTFVRVHEEKDINKYWTFLFDKLDSIGSYVQKPVYHNTFYISSAYTISDSDKWGSIVGKNKGVKYFKSTAKNVYEECKGLDKGVKKKS